MVMSSDTYENADIGGLKMVGSCSGYAQIRRQRLEGRKRTLITTRILHPSPWYKLGTAREKLIRELATVDNLRYMNVLTGYRRTLKCSSRTLRL